MSFGRKLPKSIESHYQAIQKAIERKNNPPPYGNIISDATSLLLDNLDPVFKAARKAVFLKQAESTKATSDKDIAAADQHALNSQYIQVLNFHIDRKIFPESYRSYFGIPVSSSALPSQKTETEIDALGQNIVEGEPMMIAGGGTAIPYPTLLTVHNHLMILQAKNKAHNDALDALNLAREKILALLPEATIVVRKVWDEVETHYDEGTVESRRKNARLWGVVYINTGDPVTITGHIMEMVNGAPVPVVGAKATILESEETATSGLEGALSLKTALVGTITIRLSMDTFADKDLVMDIDSAKNVDLGIIVMVKMVK